MRKTHRLITAGVLSLPLALAAGGAASAEGASYDQNQAVAGPDGVATQQVSSHAKDGGSAKNGGDASFQSNSSSVGPDGVSSDNTSATQGQKGGDAKSGGDASYQQGSSSAGPDGASSDQTRSSNDSNDNQGGLLGVLGL